MASVVVVATGACLAVTVPFMALKEVLENRLHSNMKKHLGDTKNRRCRVTFNMSEDRVNEQQTTKKSLAMKCSSDDEDNSSTISSPPSYHDITQPPAYGLILLRSE